MDGKIGYNPEELKELFNRICKTESYIAEFFEERINKVIFNPLSEAWKAPEAQSYIEKLDEAVRNAFFSFTNNYSNLISYIIAIASRWFNQNEVISIKDSAVRETQFKNTYNIHTMDSSDANGNIFVDPDKMNEIIRNASNLQMEFQTSLSNYKNNLNTSAAFFGGNMVEAINNYYNNTLKEMLKIFDFLTIGENNLKSQLEYCLKTYFERSTVSEEQKVETVEYADLPKLDL